MNRFYPVAKTTGLTRLGLCTAFTVTCSVLFMCMRSRPTSFERVQQNALLRRQTAKEMTGWRPEALTRKQSEMLTVELSASVIDLYNGIEILGELDSSAKYAVYSATTRNKTNYNYGFYLPLTAQAWNRIGYRSVVILIGTFESWTSDPLSFHILLSLVAQHATILFLKVDEQHDLMMSQVSRLFVANMLSLAFKNIGEIYFLTSDADLWPIDKDIYSLPQGKSIISLNSECCGKFDHRHKTYKMLPMANIGMTVDMWSALTKRHGMIPASPSDVIEYLFKEFGDIVHKNVIKGDNLGWYLDQTLVSVLISDFDNKNGISHTVEYKKRYTSGGFGDRIDRIKWKPYTLRGIVDAHLLEESYLSETWLRLIPLQHLMYVSDSDFVWGQKYYFGFQNILQQL